MSKIEGKAKKYDGTAIDYVSIFNWPDGKCIAQVVPDAAGNWAYSYSTNLNVGITYIAEGCEPITHGPYQFVAEAVNIYGYLFICRADVSSDKDTALDVNEASHVDWQKNFKHASARQLLQYSHKTSGVAQASISTTTIATFNIDWVLELRALSFNSDLNEHFWTVEFLDVNNNTVAAIKSQSATSKTSELWYGTNLENLQKTYNKPGAGSFGELTFTASQMRYRNTNDRIGNESFELNANILSVVAVRISGIAKAERDPNANNSVYSGGYIKVISPIIP